MKGDAELISQYREDVWKHLIIADTVNHIMDQPIADGVIPGPSPLRPYSSLPPQQVEDDFHPYSYIMAKYGAPRVQF